LCRQAVWSPKVGLKGPKEVDDQQAVILEKVNRQKENMLADYQPPPISVSLQKALTDYLLAKGVEKKHL
jgi:trimethylamine:corrinoid methyltransferase-like protein